VRQASVLSSGSSFVDRQACVRHTSAGGTRDAVAGLVSTIIPVYNRPRALTEAVSTVLAQSYRPIEVIIVDDGSTDGTAAVADDIGRRHREVRVLHQSNAGPGPARESGRRIARGEFIQYLDSDDLLLPRKFELQVSGLNGSPDCGASYGKTRYRYVSGAVEPLPWKGSGTELKTMFPSFLASRWWDTPTPLYRSDLCSKAGPWSNLWIEEDWEYDCRIAALGVRLHYCTEFVVEVRDHTDPRLCRGPVFDPRRLRDRAQAHQLILAHAERAGLKSDCPEMMSFARKLFLLARQCGAAGLARESKSLFEASRRASGHERGNGWDFRLYRALAWAVGWRATGVLACFSDHFRESPSEPFPLAQSSGTLSSPGDTSNSARHHDGWVGLDGGT
jgi:hypothetical protein